MEDGRFRTSCFRYGGMELLGISVYLGNGPIVEQIPYIRKMKDHGFQSIFTSLHIPEDDHSVYRKQLKELGKAAKELDMELMADISPESLKSLGYDWETAEELLDWGLSGLRIDYGIDENTIVQLSQKMKIALNASTISKMELLRLKEKGLDTRMVEAWHNFYPRPETGLGADFFNEKNKELQEAGIRVMAFIPGDAKLRGPLYEGLPTLEKHRTFSPFAAYLDLSHAGVDKIIIGDLEISDASLTQFAAYRDGEIIVRAEAHEDADREWIQVAANRFTNRKDPARDCIRAVESRSYAQYGTMEVPPKNTVERPVGTITIDNENYKRYRGEIQITLRDLPKDERVNVLGRVIEPDLPILKWIQADQRFKIIWIDD